jgi:hypothetical protein
MPSENQANGFFDKLQTILSPSAIALFKSLVERDGTGWDTSAYFEHVVEMGRVARERSLDYSEKMATLKTEGAKRERDAELFAKSIVENPAVMKDLPSLLKHAANYKVDVSTVIELFTKATASAQPSKA